jgi:hypothetical protein
VKARRLLVAIAALVSILPSPSRATTAASLSGRIAIDGDLSDWANDEWVLDGASVLPEPDDDSRWGPHDEMLRVGVTWDATYLYLAVEYRTTTSSLFATLRTGPGGFPSLDGAGEFRRAIDLPFEPNVLVLADPRTEPRIARVDESTVLVLVDRATAPAVSLVSIAGDATFEAALPWSMLSLENPLELATAATGGEGTGAGDAAPDASVALAVSPGPSSKMRVSLDRWLSIPADADDDGVPDPGVAPAAAVTVRPNAAPTRPRAGTGTIDVTLAASPRVFAPDRGETSNLAVGVFSSSAVEQIYATARVYSVDGSLVRVLYENVARTIVGATLATDARDRWDGLDANGRVVPGGVYVVSFEWGLASGERDGRATAGVAVAR